MDTRYKDGGFFFFFFFSSPRCGVIDGGRTGGSCISGKQRERNHERVGSLWGRGGVIRLLGLES